MTNPFLILFYHLLESTLWAFILILFLHIHKNGPSNQRLWVYRIATFKFIVPTLLLGSLFPLPNYQETMPLLIVIADPLEKWANGEIAGPDTSLLMWGWIGVGLLLGIRVMFLLVRFISRLKPTLHPFIGRHQQCLEQALVSMQLPKHSLEGYTSESGPSIGLFGIFRPRIIAKHELLEVLNDRELIAALQHEIVHKTRRDNFWRLAIDGITNFFWFHPIVWYLRKRQIIETEKACDEHVLSSGQPSQTYANCLLKAAEFCYPKTCLYSVSLSEASIKSRVINVIQYPNKKHKMKTTTIVITALALVLGSFTLLASTQKQVAGQEYGLAAVDVSPRAISQIPPIYPEALKAQGINGSVLLSFVITSEGDVKDVEPILHKTTRYEFIEPSIKAVSQWKFTPAQVNGMPVNVRVIAPIAFSAENPLFQKIKDSSNPEDQKFMKYLYDELKANNERNSGEAFRNRYNEIWEEYRQYVEKHNL